jgi:hypothetical protein
LLALYPATPAIRAAMKMGKANLMAWAALRQ